MQSTNIKTKRLLLLLTIVLLLYCSCNRDKRSEVIKEEVIKNDSAISVENDNVEKYKYIINTRTGKVHTYSDGVNRVSEKYQLKTNDSIEKILDNEKYDICLNCYAGLKLNLDNYVKRVDKFKFDDEIDLSNRYVNLISNYMRLYEFGKLDTEKQKFLICLFEVGSWYVNNVFTQLGGQKNVLEVEKIAKESASESAYNKWRYYLDREYYNKYLLRTDKRVLPVVYDEKGKSTEMVIYRCDLFKDAGYGKGNNTYTKTGMATLKNAEGEEIDKEWKNYCVIDDSSKFAAAVYYHYINKEILKDKKSEDRVAYGIDLWETSSEKFSIKNSITSKLTSTNRFDVINLRKVNKVFSGDKLEMYYNDIKIELKAGDLLYRDGHVEFYLGKNKVISWGRVHNTYTINKEFNLGIDGYHSKSNEDNDIPFVTIIQFIGGNK